MLILTRKLGETIAIGDDIIIHFLDIQGRHLRIGIEAPKNIPVYRGEIYRVIQEQNVQAAGTELKLSDLWEQITPAGSR